MSLTTNVYFRPGTRHEDVATVLAALVGAETYENDFGPAYEGWSAEVKTPLEITPSFTPTMIDFTGTIKEAYVHCTYHFEAGGPLYGPVILCGYNPHRRPVWEALADFFGAMVSMNDHDDHPIDFVGSLDNKAYQIAANDDEGWEAFQRAILAVKPVISSGVWNKTWE